MKTARFLGFMVLAALPVQATVVFYPQSVGVLIPDDTSAGLVRQISVAEVGVVNSMTVSLNLSAAAGSRAFLGDMYVYLEHESAISVLVNRPGRRVGEILGYDDNQSLTVSFSDAGSGNIHNYRSVLFANESTLLTGPLTGTWQPDGRTTDPGLVLATDSAPASLSVFNGLASEGEWRLFVADLSGGAVHQLDSWSMSLDITSVPEPRAWAVVVGVGLLGFSVFHRKRSKAMHDGH